jgi:acetoin utilization deacetylase AcuC-like enzyme
MYIVSTPNHAQHHSRAEIFNGEATPHQEVPGRYQRIESALKTSGFNLVPVSEVAPNELLAATHQPAYLQFLQDTQTLTAEEQKYPSVFDYQPRQFAQTQLSSHPVAQLGAYSFDLYTPVHNRVWPAALDAASAAYQVAIALQSGRETVGYALARPPGHHAEPARMGGYCYLNNCAVAAQYLSEFGRVATLDVDFHHGNGTQHIFYERADVLTTSIHADPNWKFPYFSGFESETGEGEGRGYNLNRCLGAGTTDEQYQRVLTDVLARITEFAPQYLVISLGLDTHADDPIGGFALTTEYFTAMAQSIAALDLPTVIVQEGGYNTELLGRNVVAFLNGFNQK